MSKFFIYRKEAGKTLYFTHVERGDQWSESQDAAYSFSNNPFIFNEIMGRLVGSKHELCIMLVPKPVLAR